MIFFKNSIKKVNYSIKQIYKLKIIRHYMADYVKFQEENEEKDRRQTKVIVKKSINFKAIIILVIIFFILSSIISSLIYSLTPKIAVVPIFGTISTTKTTSGFSSSSSTSAREISDILYALREDSSVKAVVLDINSGGGSPTASEEISVAINKLKEKKKVYAYISDTGASGAYWVAVSANKVYASKMSIVGSIGVTSATLGFEDLIERFNITYRRQTAGELKDIGTPYRTPTQKEEQIISEILNKTHKIFISHVADSRNLSYEYVQNYSTGEIFLGISAKELGLIDDTMTYSQLLGLVKNEIQSSSVIVVNYAPEQTLAQLLGLDNLFTLKLNNPDNQNAIMLQ